MNNHSNHCKVTMPLGLLCHIPSYWILYALLPRRKNYNMITGKESSKIFLLSK